MNIELKGSENMALIKCPECGKEISDKAHSCPKCGCPIAEEKTEKKDKGGIKLVAAKCPSCGANIEVDKDSNKTKCKYCESTILVDEAIEKLKIELSGEVEVKNLPKLEGILKVAGRAYDNGEYDDALEQYSAALVLDPDNPLIVLRKGICKSLTTNYAKFEITSALNGFLKAMDLEKDEDKKNQYIDEMISTARKLEHFVYTFYNGLKYVGSDEVSEMITRLDLCGQVYEQILPLITEDKNKIVCYRSIVNDCTEILKDRSYRTGRYSNGKEITQKYVMNFNFKKATEEKRKKYLDLLNELDPKHAEELKEKNQNYKLQSSFKTRLFVIIFSIVFGYYGLSHSMYSAFGFLLIINGVLLIKPIFVAIYKEKTKLGVGIGVGLCIILSFIVFSGMLQTWASKKFISITDNMTLQFKTKEVAVCNGNDCVTKKFTFTTEGKADYIKIEESTYKYVYSSVTENGDKTRLFCECDENKKCIKYFKENAKDSEYILNTKEEAKFKY